MSMSGGIAVKTAKFTFQSGYIQISLHLQNWGGYPNLHSNLVIFKLYCHCMLIWLYAFTFQSGYIQIFVQSLHCIKFLFIYIPIWLYSNQHGLWISTAFHHYLHSNLVIFKWISSLNAFMSSFFTFQSGYIQIFHFPQSPFPNKILHSNLVIFKWFYSVKKSCFSISFTFQSGYIQMFFRNTWIPH